MRLLYLFAGLLIFGCFAGCSSTGSEANQPTNSAAAANSSTTATTDGQSANSVTVVNVNTNAFNGTSDPNQKITRVDPKNDKHTSGIYGRPAPDDSTFNATMDAKGMPMEIRTFNKDPYIIKVERIFTTPTKTMKIYLKSGRVVQVPEEKLPNFAAATPGDILVAAGVDIKKLQTHTQGTKDQPPVKNP
jgi:hypothetical protein